MKIEVYSPTIRRKEMDAVLTAMVEEKIGVGDRNRLLIQTAKEQIKFDYALALRSPAVALYLALKAASQQAAAHASHGSQQAASHTSHGSQQAAVVISALSPRYYYQVIEDLQLTPIYCDVSYDFPCMSRETIEHAISQKPQDVEICAIVLHHTLGFQPDSQGIAELGFPVIEDVSQSYGKLVKKTDAQDIATSGATSGGKSGGSAGGSASVAASSVAASSVATSSVAASSATIEKEEPQIKTSGLFCILGLEERDMLTSGGGALLFAMNRKDATELRNFAGIANEYCLPDINAALAVVQFKEMQRNLQKRSEIAAVYAHASLRTRHKRFIPLLEDSYNNYSFSLVLETGLKDVIAYARKKDIIVESAFENTLAASGLCGNCPVSSSLALRTVLFPLYPRLRSSDAEHVARLIMTLP